MHKVFFHRTNCRICEGEELTKVLDLGNTPLANSFLSADELAKPELTFPLAVYFCNNCKLLQLCDVVDPPLLFMEYPYLTSASAPLAEHFAELGRMIGEKFISSSDDLVVEIGSNDGVLLESVIKRARVLGIDPSKNAAKIAESKGVETLPIFFNPEAAAMILERYGPAKVIVANNVVAHIDDLGGVFEGVKTLLREDGIFIFEAHWVGNLIGEGGFDQIYHEHLSYFSLTALRRLIETAGLALYDAELVPIHGASLRVYVRSCPKKPISAAIAEFRLQNPHRNSSYLPDTPSFLFGFFARNSAISLRKRLFRQLLKKKGAISNRAELFLKKERELKIDSLETYRGFSERVEKNKVELQKVIRDIKGIGKRIAGYGAPAKGNTLLNYCGLDSSVLDYVIDSTSFKQGRYTPGTRVPIYPPENFVKNPPDYMLLLAWNYKDAILEKEKWFGDRGGKWILPVPEVKII